jgi:hypothetical protein
MDTTAPPISLSPSPSLGVSASGFTPHTSKGKARVQPDIAPDSPHSDGDEDTLRIGGISQGADIPAVHVDGPSLPCPTLRARTDDGVVVATGDASLLITYLPVFILTLFPGHVWPMPVCQ